MLIKLAEYVCKGYQGTFKRTDVLYGDDPSRREKEREKSSSSLASLIHHYVFKRKGKQRRCERSSQRRLFHDLVFRVTC